MGQGPMTGRAAGYCAGYPVAGFQSPGPGRGLGWGGGRGFGRGMAWGRGGSWGVGAAAFGPAPYPAAMAQPSAEAEQTYLSNQAQMLQAQLDGIQARLEQIEAGQKDKE